MGSRVQVSRVQGCTTYGARVHGCKGASTVHGAGIRVHGSGLWVMGSSVIDYEFRTQDSTLRV
jgi:hypothetical protein